MCPSFLPASWRALGGAISLCVALLAVAGCGKADGTAAAAPLWAAAVATWTGNSGDVNEVVHLSAYSNALPVADMLQVTAWRDFLKQHGALVEDIQSSLMTPVHFSPWH